MDHYHIALITDDNYCIPTLVCIQSIIINTSPNNRYTIHICTFGLKDENICRFMSLSKDNVNIIIDTFDGDLYKSKLEQVSQKTHVTPTALIKFELPNYFSSIDKLLYLDGDIIVKGKIDELLGVNLYGYYLAASYDFHCRINKINYSFKRDYKDFYFNSGVMLLNLKVMRIDNITSKLWDYKINHAKTRLMDQESLNAVCGLNTLPLSLRWNFNPFFLNEKYITEINNVYGENFSSTEKLEEGVSIIHYVGKADKPWIYKDAKMREYWGSVANSIEGVIPKTILKDYQKINVSSIESAKAKIKLFGLLGFVTFLINRLLKRTLQ